MGQLWFRWFFLDLQIIERDLQPLLGGQFQDAFQALQPAFELASVPGGDKGTHAVLADDNAFSFEVEQRLAQGGAGDAQLRSQVGFGGKLLAGLKGPVFDEAE